MNKRVKEMKRLIFLLAIVLIPFVAFCEVTRKVTAPFPAFEITYYQDGKEVAKELFDEKGNLIKIIGKIPDGIVKEYDENGKLKSEATYKDNKLNGIYKWYDKNGKLQEEATYKDNKRNGIYKVYYESGKLKEEGTYKDDKRNGISKWYYESGKLKIEATYNELKESFKAYDENGNLIREESF